MLDIKQAFNTPYHIQLQLSFLPMKFHHPWVISWGVWVLKKLLKAGVWCFQMLGIFFFFHAIFFHLSLLAYENLWFCTTTLNFHLLLAMCKTEHRTPMCSTQTNPSKPRWAAPSLPREIKLSKQKVWNLGTVVDTGAHVFFDCKLYSERELSAVFFEISPPG